MKNAKGITLIALIITIIVMLILVAVTVNVAINGGLFGKADDAVTKTEEKTIYGQIVSAMVLGKDGKLNVSSTAKAAIGDLKSKGYIVSPEINEVDDNATEVILTVTGKKETYKYTITGEEILSEEKGTGGGDNPKLEYTLKNPTETQINELVSYLKENNFIKRGGEENRYQFFLYLRSGDDGLREVIITEYEDGSIEAVYYDELLNQYFQIFSDESGGTSPSLWYDGMTGETITVFPTVLNSDLKKCMDYTIDANNWSGSEADLKLAIDAILNTYFY